MLQYFRQGGYIVKDDAAYFYNEEGSPLAASPPSKFATTTVMVRITLKRKCKKPETACLERSCTHLLLTVTRSRLGS